MKPTKEMIYAACKAYDANDGEHQYADMEAALTAALAAKDEEFYPVGNIKNIGQIISECAIAGERLEIQSGVMKDWSERFYALSKSLTAALAVQDDEIERLRSQLPGEMKHCTILFKECEKGHGELTANNWVQYPCQQCEIERLRAALKIAWARMPTSSPEKPGNDELLKTHAIVREALRPRTPA